MLSNRVAMARGVELPRFRWVPYTDVLLFPLDNSGMAAASPDRKQFFALVEGNWLTWCCAEMPKLFTNSIADRQNACAIKLRRLHVQQIVDPLVGHLPSEYVEGGEIRSFLDPQSALHKQLKQCPIPEGVGLL